MKSILVTNDDGIHSEGLLRLAEALDPIGEVTVVAPDREKSAASHALTLHRPVRLRETGDRIYMVDGTPSDCVYLGALQVLARKPDLVASGINRGFNIGDDVTYSGTVAAAIEGTILGIPSFAVSLQSGELLNFGTAGRVARAVACRILADGLPQDTLLNVNVPSGELRGLRCTRQGKRIYEQIVHSGTDPRGCPYYWIGSGEGAHQQQPADTDYTAVRQGYASVTPLQLDLTHGELLERLRLEWEKELGNAIADRG